MKTVVLVGVLLLTGCQSQRAGIQPLKPADYAAIAAAASQATHQFMTKLSKEEKANNLIPKQLWGKAIEQLNPIRVEFDRVNVAIAINENEQFEEGYYFIPVISSYLPFDKNDITFEELTSREDVATAVIPGDLFYYKKLKK